MKIKPAPLFLFFCNRMLVTDSDVLKLPAENRTQRRCLEDERPGMFIIFHPPGDLIAFLFLFSLQTVSS